MRKPRDPDLPPDLTGHGPDAAASTPSAPRDERADQPAAERSRRMSRSHSQRSASQPRERRSQVGAAERPVPSPVPGAVSGPVSGRGQAKVPGAASPRAHSLAPPLVPRRRRSTEAATRRKLRWLKLVLALLLVLLVAGSAAGVLGIAQLQRLRGEAHQLATALRLAEAELARTRSRLIQLNDDLRILQDNRIPGVAELLFERPLSIEQRYLKTLTFVAPDPEMQAQMHYTAVLENRSGAPVLPQVQILLFDATGLQVGQVELDAAHAEPEEAAAKLAPGEVRRYSAPIELTLQRPARFFLVEVQ